VLKTLTVVGALAGLYALIKWHVSTRSMTTARKDMEEIRDDRGVRRIHAAGFSVAIWCAKGSTRIADGDRQRASCHIA